jgi:hypothetical protein
MATRFGIDHEGRRVEIEPEGTWSGDVLRLYVDGEQVAEVKKHGSPITVAADGIEVTAQMAWYGGAVKTAELKAGDTTLALEPEPGSRAARSEQFKRERPGLYAARHVAAGIGKVVLPLLAIGLGINLLPDIDVDLPSLPLPSIDVPLPSIALPEPPGWVKAILESAKYWGPIAVGVVIAIREWRRRRTAEVRRRRASAESGPP